MKNILLLLLLVTIVACDTNDSPQDTDDAESTEIFLDYQVRGQEEINEVTCVFQFRFDGLQGNTLTLKPPSEVRLDGVLVPGDSSRFTGSFYETQRHVEDFGGRHIITFITPRKKEVRDTFHFYPFTIEGTIPEKMSRNELVFQIKGLPDGEKIQVLAIDTSFESQDIQMAFEVRNGQLRIDPDELWDTMNGPVILQFIWEVDRPIRKKNVKGGRLSVSYSVKKEFELTD